MTTFGALESGGVIASEAMLMRAREGLVHTVQPRAAGRARGAQDDRKGALTFGITSTPGTVQPALVYSIISPWTPEMTQTIVPVSLKASGSLRSYSYICFISAKVAFLPGIRTRSVGVCTATGVVATLAAADGELDAVVSEPPQAASASVATPNSASVAAQMDRVRCERFMAPSLRVLRVANRRRPTASL